LRRRGSARLLALVLLSVLVVGPAASQSGLDEAEHEKAIAAILCDCGCHPQSVKDCACGRAAEMRQEIARLVAGEYGGRTRTGEKVIAVYVERSGEQILVAPKARGFNLLAWLGPFFLLALALLGMSLLVRRWSRQRVVTVTAGAPSVEPDDPYMNRLREELRERE
jgi:cytochrome c-type biogenesis protein CcmH